MRLFTRIAKALLLCAFVPFLLQTPAWAQQRPKVVMENVFFNVVWGSALGATLGVAGSIIASSDKTAPTSLRDGAFTGATAGGIIGLGLALYVVYQGVTFEPSASSFAIFTADNGPPPPPVQPLQPFDPPFRLIVSAENPYRISGFSARVLDLKF